MAGLLVEMLPNAFKFFEIYKESEKDIWAQLDESLEGDQFQRNSKRVVVNL